MDYEELGSLIPASEFQRLCEEGGDLSTKELAHIYTIISVSLGQRGKKD